MSSSSQSNRYLAEVEAIVSDYAIPGRSDQQSGVTHDDMEKYAKQLIGMPMTYCHTHQLHGHKEHIKHGRFSSAWIDDDDLLHVKVLIENNAQGQEILKQIQSGFLTGFSLGLMNGSGIVEENGRNRVVHQKELVEVSITPLPEFKMTSCIQHVNLTPDASSMQADDFENTEPFVDHSIKLGSISNQHVAVSASSGKYDEATEAKIEKFKRRLKAAAAGDGNSETSEKTKQQNLSSNASTQNSQPTPLSQKRKSEMSQQQQSRSRSMTRAVPQQQRGARTVVYDDDNTDNAVEYDDAGDQYDQDQMAMDAPAQQQQRARSFDQRRPANAHQEAAIQNGSMFRQQPSQNKGPIVVNNNFTLPAMSQRDRMAAARQEENNARMGIGRPQPTQQRRAQPPPPPQQRRAQVYDDDDNDEYYGDEQAPPPPPQQQKRSFARAAPLDDDDEEDERPIDRAEYKLPKVKTLNPRKAAEMERKAAEKFDRLSLQNEDQRMSRQRSTSADTDTFEDYRRYKAQLRGDDPMTARRGGGGRQADPQQFEEDYRNFKEFMAMKNKYDKQPAAAATTVDKKRRNQSVSGRRPAPMVDDDDDNDFDDKPMQRQQRQQLEQPYDDDLDNILEDEESEADKLRRENQSLKAKLAAGGKRSTQEMVKSIGNKLKKQPTPVVAHDDDDDNNNYAADDDNNGEPDLAGMGIDETIDELAEKQVSQEGNATKIIDDGRTLLKMYQKLTKVRAELDLLKSTDTASMSKNELEKHQKEKEEKAKLHRDLNAQYIEKTRALSTDGLQFISKLNIQNQKDTPDIVRKKFVNMTLKKMMTPNDINDALGFIQIASQSSSLANNTLTVVRKELARINAEKLNAIEKVKEQTEMLKQGSEKSAASSLVENNDLLAKAARTSAKMSSATGSQQQQQKNAAASGAEKKIFKSADPIGKADNYSGWDPITKLPVETDIMQLPIAQVYGVPFKVLTEDESELARATQKGFVGKEGFRVAYRQPKRDTTVAAQYITKPQIPFLRGLHRTGDPNMMEKIARGRVAPGTNVEVSRKMFSGRHRSFEKPSDATVTVDENNRPYYLLNSAATLAKVKQQQQE